MTVAVWSGIDPAMAEQNLRSLTRRIGELELALNSQAGLIRKTGGSFSSTAAARSLFIKQTQLQTALESLLRHRVAEVVNLSLDGPNFVGHSAPADVIGKVLVSIQRLYSSVAQAISTGPTARGKIADWLKQSTELRVSALYPSSFGVELYVNSDSDLLNSHIEADALQAMFKLLSSSDKPDILKIVAGEFGSRSIGHLRRAVRDLEIYKTDVRINWSDYSGVSHEFVASPERLSIISGVVSDVREVSSEELNVDGILVGASLIRNTFELLVDGELVHGRVVRGLQDKIKEAFGSQVSARLFRTSVSDHAGNSARTSYVLVSADRAG